MQTASRYFTSEEREQIAQAVARAESLTSCEIVPAVATISGRYDRQEGIVGFWLSLLAAVAVMLWNSTRHSESGDWHTPASFWFPIAVLVVSMVVAFIGGSMLASRWGALLRLCTPKRQMHQEFSDRAKHVFFDHRVRNTAGDTGVLIYVSLFEQMATVLASQAILDKLGQPIIDSLCDKLVQGFREGKPTETLAAVIEEAGRQLSTDWPRASDDVNELPDHLVLID